MAGQLRQGLERFGRILSAKSKPGLWIFVRLDRFDAVLLKVDVFKVNITALSRNRGNAVQGTEQCTTDRGLHGRVVNRSQLQRAYPRPWCNSSSRSSSRCAAALTRRGIDELSFCASATLNAWGCSRESLAEDEPPPVEPVLA